MNGQPCELCRITPKGWKGDDRKCAFLTGTFSGDNWQCATMSVFREEAYEVAVYCGETRVAVVPVEMDDEEERVTHVVLSWYKNRGATADARIVGEGERFFTLSEEIAEKAARILQAARTGEARR
jgi:hypothetical protein